MTKILTILDLKKPTQFDFKPKDHLELGEALDIIDVKRLQTGMVGDHRLYRPRLVVPRTFVAAPRPLWPHSRSGAAHPARRHSRCRFGWVHATGGAASRHVSRTPFSLRG